MKSLPNRLDNLPNRLDVSAVHVTGSAARAVPAWRKWYSLKRWRDLRQIVIIRGNMTCAKTGVILSEIVNDPFSPVVDHIKPHRGDPALFWDIDNLQLVSKQYHDGDKKRVEARGMIATHQPLWIKASRIPVTLICGPPASGKNHYVSAKGAPGDLVIDLDAIVADLSGTPHRHNWSRDEWLNAALWRCNELIGSLATDHTHAAAWLIMGAAKPDLRTWWRKKLSCRDVVVLETSAAQCRINARRDVGRNLAATDDLIASWWRQYRPLGSDIRLDPVAETTPT